jgi:hypothetical protein
MVMIESVLKFLIRFLRNHPKKLTAKRFGESSIVLAVMSCQTFNEDFESLRIDIKYIALIRLRFVIRIAVDEDVQKYPYCAISILLYVCKP